MNERHRKAGDRFIRIPLRKEIKIPVYSPKRRHFAWPLVSNPLLVGVLSIAVLIIVGGGLLMLPAANTTGTFTPPLIAFFTSASSVSTTGLALVTTATYWTGFGQVVICGLVFLGGLGLIIIVMFNLWLIGLRFTLRFNMITREAIGADNFQSLIKTLRNVVLIDLGITFVGAALLIFPFRNYYDLPTTLWQSLFHSVSAFNTAGFDIVGTDSFTPFRNNIALLSICTVEEILGALSFFVLIEVPVVRRWSRFSLDTKIVLIMTLAVSLLAVAGVFINETFLGNTLGSFPVLGKVYTSVFNGLSASTTTGFATIDFSHVTTQALVILSGVMFIGGATGSTAGGIKVNTAGVILADIWSTIKGKETVEIFKREIDNNHVVRALTVVFIGVTVMAVGMMLIMISNPDIPFEHVLFETASAFGTVGLSTGALAYFSVLGKIVIIFLMFLGRVTPLSLTMVFIQYRKRKYLYRYPPGMVRIG